MRDPINDAVAHFQNGFSCSQSILMAFGTQFEIVEETAARIASAFGGGIARKGETCGAVSGALMVLGLKYGPSVEPDNEVIYQKAIEFIQRFNEEHGSIRCQQLISYDISQPEELQAARESQVFKKVCPDLVRSAALTLTSMLKEPR